MEETECEVKESSDREKSLQIPWNIKTIRDKDIRSDKRTECNVLGTEKECNGTYSMMEILCFVFLSLE